MKKLNNLSKAAILAIFACLPTCLFGAASISGTALTNVSGVLENDFAVLLVDTSGSGFDTAALSSLGAGIDLTSSASYSGFEVLTTATAGNVFGSIIVEFNANNFDVQSQPIVTGDSFGILTFSGNSTTSTGSSTYGIWTAANWLIPANLGTPSFGDALDSYGASATPGATGTIVPEPSSFALLAGCFGLAWVMVRRRS